MFNTQVFVTVLCLGVIRGCSRGVDAHCCRSGLHTDSSPQPISAVWAAAGGGIRSILWLCVNRQLCAAPDPAQAAGLYTFYWLVTHKPTFLTWGNFSGYTLIPVRFCNVFHTLRRRISASACSPVWLSAVLSANCPETWRTGHSADRYTEAITHCRL